MSVYVLYFNGLGNGTLRRREQLAMQYLAERGVEAVHVPVDWRAHESFETLLERTMMRTKAELKTHREVVLVGSSAGGSLAVNVMSRLHDRRLYAVTLCSRLLEAKLPALDRRTLERVAYIGTPKASKLFYDSVTYCTQTAIPKLTKADKRRTVTVQQWADAVVPRQTMTIPGVRVYRVPGFGHGWGIAAATRRLPAIIGFLVDERNE